MTPADTPAQQDIDAPAWARLRQWLQVVTRESQSLAATLTRKQLKPMMRWIFILEYMLRRLVLIAAATMIVSTPPKRKPAPATHVHPTRRSPNPNAFRLYALYWPPPPPRPRITFLDAPPQPKLPPPRTAPPITLKPRAAMQADSILSARSPIWVARAGKSATPPAEKLEHKRAPPEFAAQPLLDRLAMLGRLIANPQKLIARAARKLARRRAIAERLSYQHFPWARGALKAVRDIVESTLEPVHRRFVRVMDRYANPNTS